MSDDDVQKRQEVERVALVCQYFQEQHHPTLGSELSKVRQLVKQRFPTYPVDVEHHVTSSEGIVQDVDIYYQGKRILSTKLNTLKKELVDLAL